MSRQPLRKVATAKPILFPSPEDHTQGDIKDSAAGQAVSTRPACERAKPRLEVVTNSGRPKPRQRWETDDFQTT
jgi:hypothetical protein